METSLQNIYQLLTTELGGLAYHLVLAFAVAGALQWVLMAQPASRLRRRQLFGLGALLLIQLALFLASGLAWQDLLDGRVWLPVLDRLASLLSLLVILWLWGFPENAPGADAGAILLSLLSVVGAVLGGLWWSSQAPGAPFNQQLVDWMTQVGALILALLGILILALRRPDQWGAGIFMLLLLGAGSLAHLGLAPVEGDYPGLVRLAQMAAFPFLLILPQRLLTQSTPAMTAATQPVSAPAPTVTLPATQPDSAAWNQAWKAALITDPERQAQAIVETLAEHAGAELCLLTAPFLANTPVSVQLVYNAQARRYLPPFNLDSQALPMLVSAQRLGRVRCLPGTAGTGDLSVLARQCQVERTGKILFLPVNAGDQPLASLILLTPHSDCDWSGQEQVFLHLLARWLVQTLQRTRDMSALHLELSQARQASRLVQEQVQQLGEERQRLRDQLVVAQEEAARGRDKLAGLEAILAANAETETATRLALQRLEAELQQWKDTAAQRSRQFEGLEAELAARPPVDAEAQATIQALQAEVQRWQAAAAQSREQVANMESWLAAQAEMDSGAMQQVQELTAEVERLQEAVRLSGEQSGQAQAPLELELRRALEEISLLKISLAEADQRVNKLKAGALGDDRIAQQFELIISVAQDLRQPLSSIVGYVDFLLSESVGILGASQRKYLERIKISTQRMSRLIDDLVQVASSENNPAHLEVAETNLSEVVDIVVSGLAPFYEQKHLQLRMNLPQEPIQLSTDYSVLQRVLAQLLRNASAVTPQGNQVTVSARLEKTEGQEDYVLIQVEDQGGGIPSHELPRVFSPHPPGAWLAGISHNGADLPAVKSLVELLGGRTWVDSEIGQGTTFSILLPVTPMFAEESHGRWGLGQEEEG